MLSTRKSIFPFVYLHLFTLLSVYYYFIFNQTTIVYLTWYYITWRLRLASTGRKRRMSSWIRWCRVLVSIRLCMFVALESENKNAFHYFFPLYKPFKNWKEKKFAINIVLRMKQKLSPPFLLQRRDLKNMTISDSTTDYVSLVRTWLLSTSWLWF